MNKLIKQSQKPIIKRYFPSGYYIQYPQGETNLNFVFWTKGDAETSINFLKKSPIELLPDYLQARGIPYRVSNR